MQYDGKKIILVSTINAEQYGCKPSIGGDSYNGRAPTLEDYQSGRARQMTASSQCTSLPKLRYENGKYTIKLESSMGKAYAQGENVIAETSTEVDLVGISNASFTVSVPYFFSPTQKDETLRFMLNEKPQGYTLDDSGVTTLKMSAENSH